MTRAEGVPPPSQVLPLRGVTYRPEIDGLRAVAVISVVLFHAGIGPVTGGFVGVDVFFVISGYLIMATLAADIRQGRFSVLAFYERRIRRIFPALFAMAGACLLAAALLFPPDEFAHFGQSLAAMAVFASNLFFCFEHQPAGYFAVASETNVLLHTWSLAVEEQFYILLPLGLFALRRASEATLHRWLLALFGASLGLSIGLVAHWPLGAFYLVLPRAWELLLGSLLALGLVPSMGMGRRWGRELAGLSGLALILLPVFTFSKATPFPGLAALLPCLGAALIIQAGETGNGGPSLVGRLLSLRPLVGIGLISYSLYLWHWPIIVFVKYLADGPLDRELRIIVLLASLIAGYLSYRCIERPFRGKQGWLSRRGMLITGSAAGLATLAAGTIVVAGDGLPQRFPAKVQALIAANQAQEREPSDDGCDNWGRTAKKWATTDPFCRSGRADGRHLMLWGDSHAGSLKPLVIRLQDEGALGSGLHGQDNESVLFAINSGCPVTLSLNRTEAGFACEAFTRLAWERAAAPDIDMVLIAFAAGWDIADNGLCLAEQDHCRRLLKRAEAEDRFMEDLRTIVTSLRQAGKRVVLQLPAPSYDHAIPNWLIARAILGRLDPTLTAAGLRYPPRRNDFAGLRSRIAKLAAETGATLFDPRRSLCDGEACRTEEDGVSLYMDSNHIALDRIGIFHNGLRAALR